MLVLIGLYLFVVSRASTLPTPHMVFVWVYGWLLSTKVQYPIYRAST